MVSIRAFTFALVFILVLIGNSSADHGSTGLEPARKNLANSGKEVSANSRLEARKMMLKEGGFSAEKADLKRKGNHHRHGKTKTGGFSAFSADYHVPKPHPPKHN
ncbi:hypothetical protein HRI_001345400 [Hibiscus trionum]|uniref:Uncharacterized protein n=1 Tax=Hibiscus trionum TaxID=183268 RepID=A0A9W7LUX7_HIBTR|nr:hypothetical protein HRI_001345400 [Hibiscus trionum]